MCLLASIGNARATPRCEGKLSRLQIDSRQEQTLQLLRDKKFDALQARMDRLLAMYVENRVTDEELFYEFGAFDRWGPFLTPLFQEWISKFSKSYAAHHAMALHYSSMGWQHRGGAYASETSQQQWQQFHRYLQSARDSDLEAIKLHERPILSYQLLVANAKAMPNGQAKQRAKQWLDEAQKIQPDNVIVRQAHVALLAPRWSVGSIGALEAFAMRAAHPGLPSDRFDSVAYAARMEIAAEYRRLEDWERAIEHYRRAAALCRLNQPWMDIGEIRLKQHRYAEALKATESAIELVADSPYGQRLKAQALQGLGRHAEAFELLLKLAPYGSPPVLFMLGDYYATGQGGVKRDPREARRLLTIAASAGDERAVERLKKLEDEGVR